MKLKSGLTHLLIAALLVSGCASQHSRLKKVKTTEGEIVEAEGTAPYREDDLPGTKAAALAAAQRAAVELVVGVYVNAKTRVDKAVAIENNILTHTSGYIKRYEVLSEGRSGEWYKTRIRAQVTTSSLHSDLDALGLLKQPSVGFPRVTILMQEYIGEVEDPGAHAKSTLEQALITQGYKVVQLPKTTTADQDPVEVAKSISHKAAELLMAGMGRAQSLGYGKEFGGMHSFRASVSFRIIETGTGEVVRTVSQTASGLEATPQLAGEKALEKAAQLAAADLSSLPQDLSQRAHVEVTISGLKSFEVLSKFQKSLSAVPGVKDQFLRSYVQDPGTAVLDVLIDQLSPQDLADRAVSIGGPNWSVFQVADRSIQLSASLAGR